MGRRSRFSSFLRPRTASCRGRSGVRDGIFGASLEALTLVSIHGPRSAVHLPYYSPRPAVGSASATPLEEHGRARGLLVVDREAREPFTAREEETLKAAARFVLRAIDNERVFVQLDRAKVEQGKLYRAANALAAAATEAQVIEAGVNGAREFASFDFAVVTLFDRQSQVHEICAASGEGTAELIGQRYRHNSGLVSMVVANRHALPYRGDYDPAAPGRFHAPAGAAPHAVAAGLAAARARAAARNADFRLQTPGSVRGRRAADARGADEPRRRFAGQRAHAQAPRGAGDDRRPDRPLQQASAHRRGPCKR